MNSFRTHCAIWKTVGKGKLSFYPSKKMKKRGKNEKRKQTPTGVLVLFRGTRRHPVVSRRIKGEERKREKVRARERVCERKRERARMRERQREKERKKDKSKTEK